MSFVYGMVYLVHEMEHLIFGMNYLVISSKKNFAQSSPLRVPSGKSTPA